MLTAEAFEKIKNNVFDQLVGHLPAGLTYHNASHTADVLKETERIAKEEGITDEQNFMLLRIAALFHDSGFLKAYQEHEAESCCIMRQQMAHLLSEAAIEKVCGLIMATKIPQTPATHLEEIICDADLDYLGREDFEPISNGLKLEFLTQGIVKNDREWQEKQISFFEQHHYFTITSNNNRNTGKRQRLTELKKIFSLQYGS